MVVPVLPYGPAYLQCRGADHNTLEEALAEFAELREQHFAELCKQYGTGTHQSSAGNKRQRHAAAPGHQPKDIEDMRRMVSASGISIPLLMPSANSVSIHTNVCAYCICNQSCLAVHSCVRDCKLALDSFCAMLAASLLMQHQEL